MSKKRSLLLLLLCGFVFLTCAVGSSSSDGDLYNDSNEPSNSSGQTTKKEEIEILSSNGHSDGYFYYVEGKAKNVSDEKFSSISVSFNVYDKDGVVLGSCTDYQSDVLAGETMKFKALCSGEAKAVKSYKYTGYTAW